MIFKKPTTISGEDHLALVPNGCRDACILRQLHFRHYFLFYCLVHKKISSIYKMFIELEVKNQMHQNKMTYWENGPANIIFPNSKAINIG